MSTAAYSHLELMNPKLELKYLRLEKARNRLLDELEGIDDALLNTTPAEGKWSINQIICHLMEAERLTASYVSHKLRQKEDLGASSLGNSVKSLLLKLALRSGKKFKAPEATAQVPETSSLPKLRKQWDDVRFNLEDVLNEVPADMLDKCVFRHPYAGPLSIHQTLSFLQDHFDHHLVQIQQLRRNLLA